MAEETRYDRRASIARSNAESEGMAASLNSQGNQSLSRQDRLATTGSGEAGSLVEFPSSHGPLQNSEDRDDQDPLKSPRIHRLFSKYSIGNPLSRLFIRESAESQLRHQLKRNTFYPFTRIGPSVFELRIRYQRIYFFLFLLVLSAAMIPVWATTQDQTLKGDFYLVPFGCLIVSLAGIYNYFGVRRYILDHSNDKRYYQFYMGDWLKMQGDLYNIYIRLKRLQGATERHLYVLVLHGNGIDEHILSRPTGQINTLRQLGQEMASRLAINYFDEANTSRHHHVRHFRPGAVKSLHEDIQQLTQTTNQGSMLVMPMALDGSMLLRHSTQVMKLKQSTNRLARTSSTETRKSVKKQVINNENESENRPKILNTKEIEEP